MMHFLADRIENLLPQTQCTQCGYACCRDYAEAIASGEAEIDRCPPGGKEGIGRLAALLGKLPLPLNPAHGVERPRQVALIDESLCIGCTLCIDACPVDAIVGASKQIHAVLTEQCTGCRLCVAPCPLDCVTMIDANGAETGWAAWSQQQADQARQRYDLRRLRLQKEREEHELRLKAGVRATQNAKATA